jgi:hypothetical protein
VRRGPLVLAAALALAACGGSDGGASTTTTLAEQPPTTIREATTEQVCEPLTVGVVQSVVDGEAGLEDVLLDELRRAVAIAPGEIQGATAQILAAIEEDAAAERVAGVDAAWRAVTAWTVDHCDPGYPLWACPHRTPVPADALPAPAATPEEALPEAEGERVLALGGPEGPTSIYAWLDDDDGLAVRAQLVALLGDHWTPDWGATC